MNFHNGCINYTVIQSDELLRLQVNAKANETNFATASSLNAQCVGYRMEIKDLKDQRERDSSTIAVLQLDLCNAKKKNENLKKTVAYEHDWVKYYREDLAKQDAEIEALRASIKVLEQDLDDVTDQLECTEAILEKGDRNNQLISRYDAIQILAAIEETEQSVQEGRKEACLRLINKFDLWCFEALKETCRPARSGSAAQYSSPVRFTPGPSWSIG